MIRNAFKRTWSAGGVTLVELMAAMVVLTIAALGALCYRYHAARQAGTANAQIAVTRTAHLLLGAGRSTGGPDKYAGVIVCYQQKREFGS